MVQFADVRILAFGILHRPRGHFSINENARALLHPPGVLAPDFVHDPDATPESRRLSTETAATIESVNAPSFNLNPGTYLAVKLRGRQVDTMLCRRYVDDFTQLTHPLPALSHANYPLYTPGGQDRRWTGPHDVERGRHWVGGMMCVLSLTYHVITWYH